MKKGVRADSVRMAQRLCSFGSMIVRFGSANVMSYTAGHIRVALPLSVTRNERVRVGALDLDAPAWRCVRTPRLVACSPSRLRAGSPATSGRADDGRSLP